MTPQHEPTCVFEVRLDCFWRFGVIVAAAGALAITVGAVAGVAGAASSGCNPRASKTVLANAVARVYSRRDGDPARGFALWGCAFGSGDQISIDAPDQIYAFLPPAMALNRTVLGFAFDLCQGSCETTVVVRDLRSGRDINAGAAAAATRAKVGSLQAQRTGSVAWIACPESQKRGLTASRGPNCIRTGALDSVYRLRAGTHKRELLDRGRRIDPSSLTLSGTTLSWVHSDRKRTATLQ